MDPTERIQQLESQVRQLTELVHQLKDGGTPPPEPGKKRRKKQAPFLRDDIRRNVGKVIAGEQGETLETRIGGIWLSRIAMVLFMTMVVLGARVTWYTDLFGPAQKLAVTFAASAIAVVYGIVWWRSNNLFPETTLGAGLAGLYFTIYAAFFVEGMQVLDNKVVAVLLLAAGMAVLLGVLHARRSEAAAGIALFLVYYTVVASAMSGADAENVIYALGCSAVMAIAAVCFHIRHRWLLFSTAALVATYATYYFYFFWHPPAFKVTETEYFWISNGFLTLCYLVFSLGCIFDARKTGEYRRYVGPFCGFNSAIFLTLTWLAIRDVYPAQEWMFRLAFAAMLAGFALLAEFTGPSKNYLFQIFVAKAVVMFTLALQACFSGQILMVAMALECLGLAFSYQRSGIVMFKVMGQMLLLVTFFGCLYHVKTPGATVLYAIRVPSNWFCCAGSAAAFFTVAWFYERHTRRVRPEHRTVPGQWFLADTWLDLRSGTAGLLNAAAAAFILLTITIIDLGGHPQLPYILAVEAVGVGLLGFIARTPQIEVAGVLLLVACHVCYYLFLIMEKTGFEDGPVFAPYTLLVALVTYVGAYFWERYLTRVKGGRPWEHHTVAAVPYLAATGMLATLLIRLLDGFDVALAQQGLGIILLLVGALTAYPGVKAYGILAFAIATGLFCRELVYRRADVIGQPYFVYQFVIFLMAFVVAERLFVVLQRQERRPSRLEDLLRTALVAIGLAVGAVVLWIYTSPVWLTVEWVILAFSAAALGALFQESRYRWASILMFGAAIIRAFQFDLRRLPPAYAFLSFAVLTVASLIVTWYYSRYRQRMLKRKDADVSQDHAADR